MHIINRSIVFIALAAFALCAAAADAGSPGRFTVDRYLDLQSVGAPQISPDGTQILYTRRVVDKQNDKYQTSIWIINADGSHDRFLAKGGSEMWSPDGKSIAYLAEGAPKGTQIFVLQLDVPGPASQITELGEAPQDLHWSPDGKYLGFAMLVPDPEKWSINMPAAPEGATWAKTPQFTERFHTFRDHAGFTERGWRHLFLVARDGGAAREVTHGNWSVGNVAFEVGTDVIWDFTPDGRSAITEGYKEGDADLDNRESYIYSVDLETGAAKRLTMTAGSWGRPAVAPDGKTIAYVGFAKSDANLVMDLYAMSMDGSNATLQSKGFDREPQNLHWAPDSTALYFNAEDRGSVHLYSWSHGKGVRQLTTGVEVVRGTTVGRGGAIAVVRSSFRAPGDVALINLRRPDEARQLTHLNDGLLKSLNLADAQEIWYDSSGGARIQGWVVRPPNFDPAHHYPLLLEIHGGPQAMFNVQFSPQFQNFAANGYVVLYVNPRGSTGYGTEFGNAIYKHYPGPDYDDLMAGVDAVLKQGIVDESRMYVSGCSGGGVLSSWVITHTNRFAAAAVRCPVIDWISMAGETDIPFFTYRFFKKPFWEDPTDWLAESSLMHVGNVKTPTLIMTGQLDRRTPIPQSEEFYQALKYRGVPAAMLRFDQEYHGTGSVKPSNWMRTQLYMMSWFERYSGTPPLAPPH
ncbi:MAG TPA: S9 family peptidase [Steroidobacteraceae bacterium]|jgi:dipeptidyl aminopeptidase/acylaminoacyl peptidase|nr:S9 family peptidase [Steroidobacteraceae bacterium]